MGREVSIGNYSSPEIKTLFDVSHNSVYFYRNYSFLYAKWSNGGKQINGIGGRPTNPIRKQTELRKTNE